MKNEKRLIDAYEALRMMSDSLTDNPFFNGKTRPVWEMAHDCAISCVVACPTVDAVEVVRCKHNEHYDALLYCGHTMGLAGSVAPDSFCSYGERRTDV